MCEKESGKWEYEQTSSLGLQALSAPGLVGLVLLLRGGFRFAEERVGRFHELATVKMMPEVVIVGNLVEFLANQCKLVALVEFFYRELRNQ